MFLNYFQKKLKKKYKIYNLIKLQINEIKPKIAIPTHYGSVVGTEQDAVDFVRLLHPITKGIILMNNRRKEE